MRYGEMTAFEERPHSPYYGCADATPLYVVLLDEYERWTGDRRLVRDLEHEARAALAWIDDYADLQGNGYVWYQRRNEKTGLENQCWKDSWDSISYRDGRLPGFPRATCELQGYAYDAKVRGARLARLVWKDVPFAEELEREAADLKRRFNRDFWVDKGEYFALALDTEGKQVDSLTSNNGHLLWSGIVDKSKAKAVAANLLGPRLFSGWGVRTMAEGEGRYNPIGYHVGTVWPFDNSFVAWGLRRYGFKEEAAQIAAGILDAADFFDGRLPEAFGGYPRAQTMYPVQYPTACSPQAWSTGDAAPAPAHDARAGAARRAAGRRPGRAGHDRPPRAAGHPRPLGAGRRIRARPRPGRQRTRKQWEEAMTSTAPAPARAKTGSDEGPADVLVVFGITGDLAKVMTFRSLYRLERRGLLDCPIVGVAVDDWNVDQLERARAHVDRRAPASSSTRRCSTASPRGSPTSTATSARPRRTSRSREAIKDYERPVFYLEIPPFLFGRVVQGLHDAGLTQNARVVVEKPFGHDQRVGHRARRRAAPVHRRVAALPDRPLPREDGPRRDPPPPLRQLDARAALEPELRRVRPDHDGGGLRRRGPRPLLRPGRRAARRRRQPPDAGRLGLRDGGAVARRPAHDQGRAGRALPGGRRGRPGPLRARPVRRATSTSTASRRTRPPRPTRRCASRSRTGAGPACRSSSAPASACRRRRPSSASCSSTRRGSASRRSATRRRPTSSWSSSTRRPGSG